MVVHLVHKSAAGEYAVVGLLFDKSEQDNPALQKIWERMPTTEGEAVKHDVKIDVTSLLPTDRNYYAFAGSFTTPPCTEGVKWMILKQKLTLSAAQLARFKSIIHDNARPIQPLNARKVLSSN